MKPKRFILNLLVFLYINLNIIYSIECPEGYNNSPSNGCLNGPDIISSGVCSNGNAIIILLGASNSNPCGGYSTLYWSSMSIRNNSFDWISCQIQGNGFLYNQVNRCGNDSIVILSKTITFSDPNRFFNVFSCNIAQTFHYTGELSSSSNSGVGKCNGGSSIGSSVFDSGFRSCPIGFVNNYPSCDDINECSENNGGCSQVCNNNDGSFTCSCNVGFKLNSDNKACHVDCNVANGGCSQGCSTSGDVTTCSCQAGYILNSLDNKTCDSLCNINNGGCQQGCNINSSGISCLCDVGFKLNSDNKACHVDCNVANGGCSQTCSTSNDITICSCELGFILSAPDNKTCIDINECTIPNICPNDKTCINNQGSYNCEFNHFISSVIPSTTKGGDASFIGEFSNNHKGITLLIGETNCPITYNSTNLIKCTASPGSGYHDVTLSQNGVVFIGVNKYQYREEAQTCLNSCNSEKGQGTCNTANGECKCQKGYSGFDCSNSPIGVLPPTNSTVDPNTGGTDFTNEQTNFQIYIRYLHELDFNGNKVKSFSLNDKWILNNTDNSNNNKIYKLEQMLNIDLISNKSNSVIGCKVTSIIEEINDPNGKEFEFGDTTFRIDSGSIKYSIIISNYTYSSFLNTLQLELFSSVDDLNQPNCNSKDTEIDTSDLSNFNYIKISKNKKIFSGRFINTLISDGRPTFFRTTVTKESNSVIILLNLPHFKDECLIDPDFKVLISSDFKTSCDSNNRKWVIPVAVVVSVVGTALLLTVSILLCKKNTTVKIAAKKLKKIRIPK